MLRYIFLIQRTTNTVLRRLGEISSKNDGLTLNWKIRGLEMDLKNSICVIPKKRAVDGVINNFDGMGFITVILTDHAV